MAGDFTGTTVPAAATPTVTRAQVVGMGSTQTVFPTLVPLHNALIDGTDDDPINCTSADGRFPRSPTQLRLNNCMASGAKAIRYGAIEVLEAAGLADAGNTVSISGEVAYMDDGEVYDTASSVAILRGRDTIVASVRPAGRVGIDPYSDPAFSRIMKAGDAAQTKAMLGTATVLVNQNMDEDNSVVTAAQLINGGEIMVEHGVLGDDAFTKVCIGDPVPSNRVCAPSRSHTIEDGVATFSLMNNALVPNAPVSSAVPGSNPHELYVAFDGRTAISSWAAGSASVMFTDRGRGLLVPEGGEGPLALISRGGLNTELNMAQSSAGDGGTRYQSWVRIHNNGVSAGSVTITVMDAETGDRLGSWDSGDIPAGGAIQVSAADLEDHLGHNPASGDQYNLVVEGGINGYVQHVMWNAVDGLFSDLSGFRAGGGLNTTP